MAAYGEQQANSWERSYKQGRKSVPAIVAGILVAAFGDILQCAAGVGDCSSRHGLITA
jgi:hypothetical protein